MRIAVANHAERGSTDSTTPAGIPPAQPRCLVMCQPALDCNSRGDFTSHIQRRPRQVPRRIPPRTRTNAPRVLHDAESVRERFHNSALMSPECAAPRNQVTELFRIGGRQSADSASQTGLDSTRCRRAGRPSKVTRAATLGAASGQVHRTESSGRLRGEASEPSQGQRPEARHPSGKALSPRSILTLSLRCRFVQQ